MTALAYRYTAMDRQGRRVSGQTNAASESDAYRALSAQGLVPLSLRADRVDGWLSLQRRTRVRVREIAQFTEQLAVLVNARIPLGEALMGIAEQEPNARLAAIVTEIAASVQSGKPLAAAMEPHAGLFGRTYIDTIRAAEATGSLVKVLEHLADMLARTEATRQTVRNALTYPACVMMVLVLGVGFLMGYVVPKFGRMFESRGVELPALTRALLETSTLAREWWMVWVPGLVVGGIALMRWSRTAAGGAAMERLLGRVPVVGPMLRAMAMARFCHVFSLSLSSGVGLIDALDLAGRACGRIGLESDARRIAERVRTGGRLTDAMAACASFNPMTRRMLSAGETSGELPRMAAVVARQHDAQSQNIARNLAVIIEPLLVVGIAAIVLIVALAVFLPMWDMVKLVS
ncbi:MAG: type II secretion system F family protein [Phycisphaerales bacterium]|jgi:type II secretory pathway component PulF|nr:type II secretion system F family protein [Phycisphaeraceae bacterium]